MATAKGRRPKTQNGRSAKAKGRAKRREPLISYTALGAVLLGMTALFTFSLLTGSNAVLLVFFRRLISGVFGYMRFPALLLMGFGGLRLLLGQRWSLPRGLFLMAALCCFTLCTLLQVISMDNALLQLKNGGYPEIYWNAISISFLASQNIPLGGGFAGALLGYPLRNALDVLGSVLLLFFALGAEIVVIIHMIKPDAGEILGQWLGEMKEDWSLRREERQQEKEEARQEKANAALLAPIPPELLEQDEEDEPPMEKAPPRAQTKAKAARKKIVPAASRQAQPPKPRPPVRPAAEEEMQMPGEEEAFEPRPSLYIEDIVPQNRPSQAYTAYDVEKAKQRMRRRRGEVPEFLSKRRVQYDEQYGAFGGQEPQVNDWQPRYEDEAQTPEEWEQTATEEPQMQAQVPQEEEWQEPQAALVEEAPWDEAQMQEAEAEMEAREEEQREESRSGEDVPWESVEEHYEPTPQDPAPLRRPVQPSLLSKVPQLDPETRLDRPDWKPPQEEEPHPEIPAAEEGYRQPPFSLLVREENKETPDTREADARGAKKLEETLESFGVSAHVIKVVHGPAITRYELQPAPGVKVSKIVGLVDDIALNMAAVGVRIEAPIPGKAAVGIEIANSEIATVHLRDVLESEESARHSSKLAVALGKDIAGKRIIADLAKMPHLLIAGATGSGKSVCINTLIVSIIYRTTPEEVRLILVDPKKVELSVYNGIPHLLVPVVTDPKKASGALNWAVMEMDERYKRFSELGVRDIKGYNAARPADEPLMPSIVVVIDELSDLMLVAPGEVEESICRLAQLARACGIHLVIATQRPSVNVITGIIKANIPSRIAFAVSSQVDSRTILDSAGAEKLLGKGDMLFAPAGGGKPLRVQGCFVSDSEVSRVVEYVKDRHTCDYSQAVIEALEEAEEPEEAAEDHDANDADYDALLEQAVEMAVESGQASISMLQRRLRVGYARAGRLVDEMARRGIIGQAEGAKPRQVLITREDMQLMFKKK